MTSTGSDPRDEDLISLPEAAKLMKTPYETVYGWHQTGTLPFRAVRRGRRFVVHRRAVENFLDYVKILRGVPDMDGLKVVLKVAQNIASAEEFEGKD